MPITQGSSVSPAGEAHASGDRRFKLLEAAIKRHQHRQDALIEVLHAAQDLFGCLEVDLMFFIAHHLKVPPSRVYGVATFYHFFTLKPKGRHTCVDLHGHGLLRQGSRSAIESGRGKCPRPDRRHDGRRQRIAADGPLPGHVRTGAGRRHRRNH